MIRNQEMCMITGTVAEIAKAWCITEYLISDGSGAPPVSMLITACKLTDAYTFADPNRNSEWRKYVTPAHAVMVHIHAIGTRQECQKRATTMIMGRNPRPRGNVYGFNSFSIARPLKCSNDQVYENQAEAARLLGLNQGAISRHLKGELRAVKGYTFVYMDQ